MPCHKAGIIEIGLEHFVTTTKQGYFEECQEQCYKDKGAGQKEFTLTKMNQSGPSEKKILILVKSVTGQEFKTMIQKVCHKVYKKEVAIQRENKTCIIIRVDFNKLGSVIKIQVLCFSIIVSTLHTLHIYYTKE